MLETKITVRKPQIWLDEIELQQCPVCVGNNPRVDYVVEDTEISGVGKIMLPTPKQITCQDCGLSANIDHWNELRYNKGA